MILSVLFGLINLIIIIYFAKKQHFIDSRKLCWYVQYCTRKKRTNLITALSTFLLIWVCSLKRSWLTIMNKNTWTGQNTILYNSLLLWGNHQHYLYIGKVSVGTNNESLTSSIYNVYELIRFREMYLRFFVLWLS